MSHHLLLLSLCLLPILSESCLSKGSLPKRVHVRDNWFVDEHGRVRTYHGINAVQKGPDFYPTDMLNDTLLRYYKDWGFNVVRLGTMWAGAMPVKDQFNQTYFDILKTILTKLEKYGMTAILDMHQDVLSTKFHSYDGAPRWLVDSQPPPKHPYPWPLAKLSQWGDGYLTEAVGVAFTQIYNNTMGARDYLVSFWTKVASEFRGVPNVLGYELINEPWAGDIYQHPELLLPGFAGSESLMPTYNHLNKGIRTVDNDTIIFFEPVTWGVLLNNKYVGSGFTTVPGGPDYRNRSVFSYHHYCPIQGQSPHKPYKFWKKFACDDLSAPDVFIAALSDMRTMGSGSFMTEFGTCYPDGRKNSSDTVECETVMRLADYYMQSWTYWYPRFFSQSGQVNWDMVLPFARVYARAVAGIPTINKFDPNTKIFELAFQANPDIVAPSEIFVPSVHYPTGFDVTVFGGIKWVYMKAENLIFVTFSQHVEKGAIVGLTLNPKPST